jgi:CMP-N-acetylneuraminic acid synthetase
MTPGVVGLICARGGSKGVPRKNLRLLGGKPLIAHAIEAARGSRHIESVMVSTDDAEIADAARQWGADVPFIRPADLARDDSAEWLVWRHAVTTLAADPARTPMRALVAVPTTSPFRTAEDVDRCIDLFLSSDADVVFAITEANRNPYFNMVRLRQDGQVDIVIRPDRPLHRRQDAPEVYDMTTAVYAVRPRFVLDRNGLFEGRARAVVIPRDRALDIDTEFDFKLAEFVLAQSADRVAAR